VTIPKNIREKLHISNGDKIDFRINANGAVEIVPINNSVDEVYGCLSTKIKKKLSIEEMNATIANRSKDL